MQAWPIINELAGRKCKPPIRIKGESAEKRKESWLSHFLNLLGGQLVNTQVNRPLPLIQIAELLDLLGGQLVNTQGNRPLPLIQIAELLDLLGGQLVNTQGNRPLPLIQIAELLDLLGGQLVNTQGNRPLPLIQIAELLDLLGGQLVNTQGNRPLPLIQIAELLDLLGGQLVNTQVNRPLPLIQIAELLDLLGGQLVNTQVNRPLTLIQIAELLDISTSPFTIHDLSDATETLSVNKSPGLDNIPSLVWKDPLFHDLLLKFCNHTFTALRPPSAWLKSGIVPIPKKVTWHCLSTSEEFPWYRSQLRSTISSYWIVLYLQ